MQGVKIICVGRLKDTFFKAASEEYLKRLKAYCKTEIIEINASNLPDNPSDAQIEAAIEKEGEAIMKKLPQGITAAAMCIEGKQISSEDMAQLLAKAAEQKNGNIAFIIGGSYGLSQKVKDKADFRISASKMTFPHRLFRVMLLEQIYRGYKINEGSKYHK